MSLILEGTWEDVKTHEAELTGRYVKLIVESETQEWSDNLPTPLNTVRDETHLEELLLAGLRSPRHEVTDTTFDEIRAEVRRRLSA